MRDSFAGRLSQYLCRVLALELGGLDYAVENGGDFGGTLGAVAIEVLASETRLRTTSGWLH